MTPVRLLLGLVAAAILVAPAALAASARGEIAATGIDLVGGGSLASAGVEILHDAGVVPTLSFEATDVVVQRMGYKRADLSPLYELEMEEVDERASFSSARLSLSEGAQPPFVVLRSAGPGIAQLMQVQVRALAGQTLGAIGEASTCDDANAPELCIEVAGVYEVAGGIDARLDGELLMLIHGATLDVSGDGQTASFASGYSEGPDGVRAEDTWIYVRAASAKGSFVSDAASIFSSAPTITTLEAAIERAEGVVKVGSREYRASEDTIVAKGELVLVPGAVAPASPDEYATGPVYASGFTTRISGDIQSINLNAAPAFLDSSAERGIFAALAALAIAGLAYAWQHIAFFAAALYTRLNKPDILDNDVRSRIYAIIRENPGISAREVHRRSEQSWGTVVYHLRQLERHHLVVSRSLGRTRNYYENHGKYRGMEVQLACLQSDRARVLARAIAGQPGITQEQLAAASGYPQPTTSYYVRKLKQAGLVVEQREGRYVKYVPHGDLPRFIAMSDSAPATNAPAASGVQA